MNKLADAIQLAAFAHSGQKDKAGEEYILHPLRVMLQMETEEERIVAVLHDVIEDTVFDAAKLREYSIPEKCVVAIEALTKKEGEALNSYYARIRGNGLALQVKLRDIADNMDWERINKLDPETRDRLDKKYRKALYILTQPFPC